MSYLVIVESPGKIKKISEYLGNDYVVMASIGHIIDLYANKMSIDLNTFEPEYTVYPDKVQVVDKLAKQMRKLDKSNVLLASRSSSEASNVLLASDEDREGEMIAWSLAKELNLKNPKRIVFNSITKKELQDAVKKPSIINDNMVYAQQTRRILDRFCGYLISPLLPKVGFPDAKSAGRVQSVVVKLIVEKELEIRKFFDSKLSTYFVINGIIIAKLKEDIQIKMILHKLNDKIKDNESEDDNSEENKHKLKFTKDQEEEVISILKNLTKAKYKLYNITSKISKSNPPPPYTTSTLQQDASRKLNMDSKRTMSIAQKLYQEGHITYMRTDSTNISPEASGVIKNYITEKYTEKYYKYRTYKNKKNNTQEAHECIRPTKINYDEIDGNAEDKKLYKLIWKRTIQSQMAASETQNVTIELSFDRKTLAEYKFVGTLNQLLFEGYLIIDGKQGSSEINAEIFKKCEYEWNQLLAQEDTKKPPVRYNEPSLINKLDPKNLNIGRPSTYASILDKINSRQYVETKDVDGKKLKLTEYTVHKSDKPIINVDTKEITIGKEKNKLVPTELGINLTHYLDKHFSMIMDYQFTANMEQQLDDIAEGKLDKISVIKPFYDYIKENVSKLIFVPKEKNIIGKFNDNEIIIATGKFGKYVTCGEIKFSLNNMEDTSNEAIIQKVEYLHNNKDKPKSNYLKWEKSNSMYIFNNGQYGPYVTEWKFNKKTNTKKKLKNHSIRTLLDNIAKEYNMDVENIDSICNKLSYDRIKEFIGKD